ncbi:hypothetical protein CSUI_002837 [Cystoisospora suis]|uniref:Uncharacterized protein n=1 Tax=Cystoisospora suis TaxID=483139 RepID=A0A2C6L385_9APIC|nr:hypothetical protein CSUI_002837 [Cystoisospora suis]
MKGHTQSKSLSVGPSLSLDLFHSLFHHRCMRMHSCLSLNPILFDSAQLASQQEEDTTTK